MAVGHQHDLFIAFFGKGNKWGIPIEYYVEKKPMGTAGAICHIDNLDNNF